MAEEVPRTNNSLKRASSGVKDHNLRKKHKKGKNIVLDPPTYGVKICQNLACKATLFSEVKFCKRCSCYICERYDENKDPSLWLECSTDSVIDDSCGFSCHVECALKGKIEDGTYICASCGRVSSVLRCWKKQLIKAKDCRLFKDFCYRICLSYRLLNGSSKYKELHKLIEDVKGHLEEDFKSPIHEYEYNERENIRRLSLANKKLDQILHVAMENADKLLSASSSLIPICDVEPQNFTVTELESGSGSGSGSGFKVNNTMIDLNVPLVPDLNEELHEFDATKKSGLDDNFEKIVNTICCLELEGHIREVFRKKFLTWFSLKAGDQDRRIVCAFQQAMADTPTNLANQLIDTFSDFIFN